MYFQTIYCDLDGVLADFHLEAVRAHMRVGTRFHTLEHYGTPLELTHEHLYQRLPKDIGIHKFCVSSIPNEVGDFWQPNMDKFWSPIRTDPFFWKNMPAYPWLYQLVKLLANNCEHLVFVTTPDTHHNSYSGKYFWMEKHNLTKFEFITAKNKWRLAHPRCLIVDDFGKHITAWLDRVEHLYREPGHALLFPQPWNNNHHLTDDRLGYIEAYLKEFH